VLGLFLFPFRTPASINLLFLYLLLIIIYAACFWVAFITHGGFFHSLRALARGDRPPRIPNWLVVMPLASSALLLVVILLTLAQERFGVPTGSLPPFPDYFLLFWLTYSPILEEWIFRISPLGLVVGLRIVIVKGPHSSFLLSFVLPDRAKAQAGLPHLYDKGWRGIHWSEWLGLAITSLIFGLAHLLAGGGWQVGKVLTATLSALVLGIAFLVYGGYASVLLHWFFNFYFEIFALGSSLIGGILDAAAVLVSLITIALGVVGLVLAARYLLLRRRWGAPSTNSL